MKNLKLLPCSVLMLYTGRAQGAISVGVTKNYMYSQIDKTNPLLTNYELCFTSKRRIEEGDKCYDRVYKRVVTVTGFGEHPKFVKIKSNSKGLSHSNVSNLSKIEASTDANLKLPNIPPRFIHNYTDRMGAVKKVNLELFRPNEGYQVHEHWAVRTMPSKHVIIHPIAKAKSKTKKAKA